MGFWEWLGCLDLLDELGGGGGRGGWAAKAPGRRRSSRMKGLKNASILRILINVPSILEQVDSVAVVVYDNELKELTDVISTEGSVLSRRVFFDMARDALPLNKAFLGRTYNPQRYAEPVYDPRSTVLGVLVCESDARGLSTMDRQVLKTINMMVASFILEGLKIDPVDGEEHPVEEGVTSPKGDSFVATFSPKVATGEGGAAGGGGGPGGEETPVRGKPQPMFAAVTPMKLVQMEQDSEALKEIDYNYNPFSVSEDQVTDNILAMFDSVGVLDALDIPADVIYAIVLDVKSQYSVDVAFHNFNHVYTVLQMCYLILKGSTFVQKIVSTPVARFALLMSALCHDMNHPGNNNDFEIKSESDLAILYNDISVLENLHCSSMFETLRRHNLHKFMDSNRGEWKDFRDIATTAIMSTDMSQHKVLLQKVLGAVKDPGTLGVKDWVAYIVHTADLGNLTLDWDLALMWEDRIFKEFEIQAEREQKMGLEVATYMLNLDEVSRAKIQLGFIDYVLLPWWEAMNKLIPNDLEERLVCLKRSRENYTQVLKALAKKEQGEGAGGEG